MSTIQVYALGTRVVARVRLDSTVWIPGTVRGAFYTGAGLRYTIDFDNNFTTEVLADRVRLS